MTKDDDDTAAAAAAATVAAAASSKSNAVPAVTPSSSTTGVSSSILARTHSNVSFHRSPTTERINEILENARERAETMGAGAVSPKSPKSQSPRAPENPIGRFPSSNSTQLPIPEDSSADEMTGIVSRGSDLNYQAIQVTNTHSSGPRVRNGSSRASRGSIRSQLTSRHTDAFPPTSLPDMEYTRQPQPEKHTPWWQAQLKNFQSIELENKGSVARDHLAIERTFLAWLRTSLAFASIGIAVTQLFRLNTSLSEGSTPNKNTETLRHMGRPLGATFLGISILILFLGYKRYFHAQHWVMQGKFPASRGTVTIVAFVAFAIMVASLVVVIVIHPSTTEL